MKKAFFLMLLALPLVFGFSSTPVASEDGRCSAPHDVTKSSGTGSTATYTWSAVSDASTYKVKYVRLSDGYASQEWNTAATSFTFTGLTAGAYKFYFATVCGGDVSEFIIIDDVAGN